ncbi:alpha/beta-hydrolase [Neolentinus lepideus HHB14362 ss-1]|uniref:Alpha/beta-hydrolase n=1 Tax=Neolentinus lepideus HHB14362 ss-1 TaxID=1314782 RepID=A0A165R182_9AGAM|nr:alpha/beta-hydrolase [Neolentinus lepideus HHB14362 ss-1]
MNTPAPLDTPHARLRFELRHRHVRQLSQIGDDYKLRTEPSPDDPINVQMLMQWTQEAQQQFDNAVAKQIFGQKGTISWEIAIVTFLEAAAMYLRDVGLVVAAIKEAKAGNKEKATEYLVKSEEGINEIAAFWGFEYTTICDLFSTTPDGHLLIVGPFCGAFSPKDQSNPFIGIGFKGTSSTQEMITDIVRQPQATGSSSILWGTNVSAGVFNCLFGTYGDWGVPMDHIMGYIQTYAALLPEGANQLITHVTGHSLGASYATLCYAQLLQCQSTNTVLGDLYAFGSPRIGENSFASQLKTALKTAQGSTWRVVDQDDSVTALPPAPAHLVGPLPLQDDPRVYIHVDSGYRIFRGNLPVAIESEIDQDPGPAPQTVEYISDLQHEQDHSPVYYWASLLVANGTSGV